VRPSRIVNWIRHAGRARVALWGAKDWQLQAGSVGDVFRARLLNHEAGIERAMVELGLRVNRALAPVLRAAERSAADFARAWTKGLRGLASDPRASEEDRLQAQEAIACLTIDRAGRTRDREIHRALEAARMVGGRRRS
jgi:hypothetical protein